MSTWLREQRRAEGSVLAALLCGRATVTTGLTRQSLTDLLLQLATGVRLAQQERSRNDPP